jgi:hypothetical protein
VIWSSVSLPTKEARSMPYPRRKYPAVDKPKNRVLKCRTRSVSREAQFAGRFQRLDLSPRETSIERRFTEVELMDMFGKVGLVEVPILIAPDQKAWMDRMIKEGKIAIPPGGTLEKGSLYSMFVRMLLHNAMEEQKRQEVLDAEDEDDDE